jgi:hypothetical protein
MAFVEHYTIGGRLWASKKPDGTVVGYGSDALGSVVSTYESGSLANRYRFKPYGSMLSKSGTADDPRFLWGGSFGYRHVARQATSHYVRARHYDETIGQWTTVDPLWWSWFGLHFQFMRQFLIVPPYIYGSSSPQTRIDVSGLDPELPYGISLDIAACSSLQIPVFPNLAIGLQYCRWCYRCICPVSLGPWATACWSLEGHATYRIGVIDIGKGSEGLREVAEHLLRLLTGAGMGWSQCQRPEPRCIRRSRSGDFSLCVRGCLAAVSFSCCLSLVVDSGDPNSRLRITC